MSRSLFVCLLFGCLGLSAGCGPCDDTGELCLLVEEAGPAYLSVRAPADDDVWIVGTEVEPGASGPTALHWDGQAWESLDLADQAGAELWWVHPGSQTITMVGSAGLILEHDRSTGSTTQVEGPDPAVTFFGVWGASDDDLWAVGGDIGGALPAQLWRKDGDGWSEYVDPSLDEGSGRIWFKVHGTAADDLWIVGSQSSTLHWDGSSLTEFSASAVASGESLFTVDAAGEEVLAVGGSAAGALLHWDGSAWENRAPEFAPGINGVCSGGGLSRAVGAQGSVYELEEGSWSYELVGLTQRDYHACALSPGGELWAVGGQIVSRPLSEGLIAYAGDQRVAALP